MAGMTQAQVPERVMGPILSTVIFTFIGYFAVALPLAVLPTYVAIDLGFGAPLAGVTIGTQYLATILSRAQVGRMSDSYGPKRAVVWGFAGCLISGLFTLSAAIAQATPRLDLGLILCGRLALGLAESWISTGAITWSIGQVGARHMVRIISWNGIATYAAMTASAPLGVWLVHGFGFIAIGLLSCGLALVGLGFALAKRAVAIIAEARLSMRSVFAIVLPFGTILALGGCGFGVIAAFVTLFFGSRHWDGAAVALSCFGLGFIASRLLMGDLIARRGGLRVTLFGFIIEAAGLLMLWLAPVPVVAIAGAGIVGFGFAPIFPALGTVAVGRVPPQSRGAAIGLYSVFVDVSLAATGPIAGLLVQRWGTPAPFGFAVATTLLGLMLTAFMLSR